jgi:hypothetical protein
MRVDVASLSGIRFRTPSNQSFVLTFLNIAVKEKKVKVDKKKNE